jgi:predicted Zn-dependent peptidase
MKEERVRSVSIGIYINEGGRFETPETMGITHFIEHMLFKGTATRTSLEIAQLIDYVGGQVNAYTSKAVICAYANVASRHINQITELLCEIVTNSAFDENDVATERGVILEEIAMCEDDPSEIIYSLTNSAVWEGSMLGAEILGTRETVGSFTGAQMKEYARERFTPEKIIVSVCGNFNDEEIVDTVCRYFSSEPANPSDITLPERHIEEAKFVSAFVTERHDFEQNKMTLCFPAFSFLDARYDAMYILSIIIGGGSSSRLFRKIREQLGLVYDISCYVSCHEREGMFCVSLSVGAEKEEIALSESVKILRETAENGVSEEEFIRAKEHYKVGCELSLEEIHEQSSLAASDEAILSYVRTLDMILADTEKITLEEINTLARELIDFGKCSFISAGNVKEPEYYSDIIEKYN